MKKIKTFDIRSVYSSLGNLDANKLCSEYTPADVPFNLHHLTHCISDEQKEAEAALKVGEAGETFRDKIDAINESYKDIDRQNNALREKDKLTSDQLRDRRRENLLKHYRQAIELTITTLQREGVNCDHVDVDALLKSYVGNLYTILSRVYKEAKAKHIERLNKIYERKLVDDEQIQADHVSFVNAALNKIEALKDQKATIAKFNNRVKWIDYLTFNIDRKRINNSN